jgi:hypothetical protein
LFDDLGRPRFDGETFGAFNGDTVLLLQPPPRRAWVRGGDRRSGFDLYHHKGGEVFQATVCVSHFGTTREKAPELSFRLERLDGNPLAAGTLPIKGEIRQGFHSLEGLAITLPPVSSCTPCRLCLSWPLVTGTVSNAWPLWIHPAEPLEGVKAIHLHDPRNALDSMAGLQGNEHADLWVVSAFDKSVLRRLAKGKAVLLMQGFDYPLESKPLPFWREGVHLVQDHPLARRFPFQDGGTEELLALTSDRFFTGSVEDTGFDAMAPVLSRLDLHSDNFSLTHALVELKGYPGRCFATTLRLAGGMGDLPLGLKNNRAGQALLAAVRDEIAKG